MDRQISIKELVAIIEQLNDERVVLNLFNEAITQGKFFTVKTLSRLVIKKNQRDENGFTSFHYAAQSGNLEIVKYLAKETQEDDKLMTTNERWTTLHLSSKGGHRALCQFFIEICCIDVDCRDIFGYTPLHYACEIGNVDVVRYLLRAGADANIISTDDETVTAECLARNYNHRDVLHVLDTWRDVQEANAVIEPLINFYF